MAVPTRESRGSAFEQQFINLSQALVNARRICVSQKAAMVAGSVSISSIISGLYVPLVSTAAKKGIWKIITEISSNPAFMNYYYEQIGLRFPFDADDVNLGTDKITLNGNEFLVGDPVKIEGPGTPPGGLTKGTNYFVEAKTAEAISFKPTPGGSIINLTSGTAGQLYCEFRAIPSFTTLIAALEEVIDQIIIDIPTALITLEIRALKFDKTLSASTDGLELATLASIATSTLQTKLQDVVDAIEVPL